MLSKFLEFATALFNVVTALITASPWLKMDLAKISQII